MKHILSKSTFMYGCQCPKRLYLHKYKKELRNPVDEYQQTIFNQGTSVGELARDLFKGGVDASPPDSFSYQLSVANTTELIKRGETIIYEAAFQFEGVLCAFDIIVKRENAWHAFEVKSAVSVKDQYIQDAALQYHVLTGCGLPVEDISIIHVNKQYTRNGALDIQQLFTTTSILAEVLEQQDFITSKIIEFKTLLGNQHEPVVDIGKHCSVPYGCDFTAHCWSHIPKVDSVFDLARGAGWKLYEEGYTHLDDIPKNYELSDKVAQQLAHYHSGDTHIDKVELKQFLEPLRYPLHFFDFETINLGIPEFDGSRPYQQIPFQFSLHIQQTEDSALEHYAFLGDGETDPRSALMEEMLRLLGQRGSVICYNRTFEKSRIKELAILYPSYKDQLLEINERVVDLMVPFQKRWYYHPEFKGSYSIKNVLPVLIPELRYDKLEIQEGGMASMVYAQLKYQDANTRELQREQLLEYCKLDTLAMVRIYQKLKMLLLFSPS